MNINIHYFDSTSEAYGASQCDDDIKDGDLLIVKSEMVYGVLVGAWPTAVIWGMDSGSFHTQWPSYQTLDEKWGAFRDGKYLQAAQLANKMYVQDLIKPTS